MIDAPHAARFVFALTALLMIAATGASAQKGPAAQKTAAPPPQAAPVEQPPAPVPEAKPENPGLLNELGKLFVKPSDLFPSLKSTPDNSIQTSTSPAPPSDSGITNPVAPVPPKAAMVPAPPPATVNAPAPPKLPSPGLVPLMVNGRAPCPISANGSPDCKAGADKLCQDKGYAGGRSLDMDTAHNCSTKALLAGARTIKDICRTENFVTRAMCQ